MVYHSTQVRSSFQLKSLHSYYTAVLNGNGAHQSPSRLQRARLGVHLNRRVPSKDDYLNFALYQANQKAYEATFVKNFVAHALHPDQINACFLDDVDARASLEKYLKRFSHQVSIIPKKMAWNAHYHVIHLFASDGKDGAPFLDVNTINPKAASDFGPGNIYEVARKMNGSWHRAFPEPVMVQFSTEHYRFEPNHTMPLEEIDEVVHTLFNSNAFDKSLPNGRASRPPTSKKRKGQYAPGAAVREERNVAPRGNWLHFKSLDTRTEQHSSPSKAHSSNNAVVDAEMPDASQHPTFEDLGNIRHNERLASPSDDSSSSVRSVSPLSDPWLEELFDSRDTNALDHGQVNSPSRSDSNELVEKVLSWRMRLINDHKRRLTRKWGNPPQTLDKALPGIRQAIAAAFALGLRRTTHNYRTVPRVITLRKQRQYGHFDQLEEEDATVTTKTTHPIIRPTKHTPKGRPIPGQVKTLAPPTHYSPSPIPTEDTAPCREPKGKGRAVEVADMIQKVPKVSPNKRRKTEESTAKQPMTKVSTKQKKLVARSPKQPASHTTPKSLPPHLSESKTLEPHQQLPPNAYFVPDSIDDKPVWRCGVKHAMGHYYNAGDRKSCRGCNTALSDNPNMVQMDFYMPSRSFHHQPAPGMIWKPNKPSANLRKSHRPCHNGVAKDAYWSAINAGATEDEARQMGVNAIAEFLKPKPSPKAPTPEPKPEPEPNLGPHPSGSKTMEHGQEYPVCAYEEKLERHEELAWRCDVRNFMYQLYMRHTLTS
jgi:hypothetical protein